MATDPTAHGRVLRPDPNPNTAARGRCGRSPTGVYTRYNWGGGWEENRSHLLMVSDEKWKSVARSKEAS